MNDEKWGDVVDLIEQKFGIIERNKEEVIIGDDFEEDKARESIDSIIFNGPLGKMKVQRITRPIVLDKKVHYTKTMGQGAKVEYTYSDDEFTHRVVAYKWGEVESSWIEIEAGGLKFS
ncbi:hypothetical protein COX95_00410 [bacterium CG_4_10_14_0_2_um_filter_33_32]|nr:MAG: hypothetical protein AUJ93_01905 [bacterium CG2_30_33_46]PIU76664.1 MAG: hypothetical protein COS74_02815 [bacterium CG06_land_8_20_14_3_00_33_50]PIY85449.1 MAG: hypothetical protein COY76_02045 [bacterium CG_4_10_14_0_8_um_filter_33_57]PIZ86646.1 MAG: hypothetical protein COX95_00410 [bacterium CG_4_10_14_0_2_um_filter_33_32]